MTCDIPLALLAARRLSESLPVRTHLVLDDEPNQAHGGTGRKKAVEISGIVYPSLRRGADAHGISVFALMKWFDSGRARFV